MLTIKLDENFCLNGQETPKIRLIVANVTPLMEDQALQGKAMAALSPQRRAKAEACGNSRVRALSIGVALALDRLLAEHGWREQQMTYTEGEHGKPRFDGEASHLAFNLSHSASMVAAAMMTQPGADTMLLGVDIQRITRYRPELVRRMFNANDRAELATCKDEAARERRFAQLWCRAEAYAKATGNGLQWPFPIPPHNAQFMDFDVGEDYCGCICVVERLK